MDLSIVYSKTPKGLRARASLIGGLSSHLMKVLTHVDGNAKAESILLKFDHLTPQQLSADLTKLLQEGYIRLASITATSDGGWALTTNFAPMVVEEYQSEEELEATTLVKTQQQASFKAEQEAKQAQEAIKREEDVRLAAELKANKKAQKLRAKEKTKAEVKVKAKLAEEEHALQAAKLAQQAAKEAEIAQKKAEAEANLIAEQAKLKAQIVADRVAKEAEEAQQKAELKAREAAEQAQAEAEQKAKDSARREIDRIAKVAEEAQRKQAAQNKAKLEAERIEALRLAEAEAKREQLRLQAEQEKLEAEQKLIEVKRKAIEEAELATIKAEHAAKIEAESKQKEELAITAKVQAKENARVEIANIVRKAEQDRKQAVAKAKAEKLEAKRIAKAEADARIKADKKLKEVAKEQAKTNKAAAEKVRLAQSQLTQKAAESAKQQAEIDAKELLHQQQLEQTQLKQQQANQAQNKYKAEQAAEIIRAKADNEEQAAIAAKENSRLEMERIGREADLVRQKQTVEQHKAEQNISKQYMAEHKKDLPIKDLPILDDFDAAEAAEEAAFEAEERAAEQEIKVVRTLEKSSQQAKEDAGRAHIKQTAIAEAAQKESLQPLVQSHFASKQLKKIAIWLGKLLLIYVPIGLIIVIGLLHFINISMLIKPIEQIATNAVAMPVTISKVHASVWPQPHLVLEGVSIGTENTNQTIQSIHVLPAVSSLFDDTKIVKSLVIEGVNIQHTSFSQALGWINNAAIAKNLKIEQVNLKNLSLNIQDLHLEPFDGKLNFTQLRTIKSIDLVSKGNALAVTIMPQADNYTINLKAANWALPFNPKVVFSALDANGVISQNQIEFSKIIGEIYGGNLTAEAKINWPENNTQWAFAGSFNLAAAYAPLLLTAFGSSVSIDGKLKLDGSFSSQAKAANQLGQAVNVTANFNISQGSIGDIELARAVIARGSQSLAGNATNFDRLTGSVKINQGQYQYAKLMLSSPQFHANGYLNINNNEEVSGKINADLAAQSRRLQAKFTLTGRGKDLKSN